MKKLLLHFLKRQFLLLLLVLLLAFDVTWAIAVGVLGLSGWLVWVAAAALFGLTVMTTLWCMDLRDWWTPLELANAHHRALVHQRAHEGIAEGRPRALGIVWTRGAIMSAVFLLIGIGLFAAWLFLLVDGALVAWALWLMFAVAVVIIVAAGSAMALHEKQKLA